MRTRLALVTATSLASAVGLASAQHPPFVAGCLDGAASNALPSILLNDATGDNNTVCTYTCAGLAKYFGAAEGDPSVACYIDSGTEQRWPSGAEYTAPVNSTVLFQGHGDWPSNGGTALATRVNVVTASVIIRYVHMEGLIATPQGTGGGQAAGGAVYVFDGSLIVEHVLFSNNSAAVYGGAIAVYEAQDILIRRSYFYNNTAGGAAAIYIRPGRNFRQSVITESRGSRNTASGDLFALVSRPHL